MPGPFSFNHLSDRFFILPSRRGMEETTLTSEIFKACARLDAALTELIAAETQLHENLSDLVATEDSYALDQVRIARLECHIAAEDVFKLRPQTNKEKMLRLDVIAVYLTMSDLDQLELFAMLGPNLLSQCRHDMPMASASSTRPRSSLWTTRLRIGLPLGKASRS